MGRHVAKNRQMPPIETIVSDRPIRDILAATAFDASPWPAVVFEADAKVLIANEAAEMLFGQALATLARRPLPSLLAPESELAIFFEQARRERGAARRSAMEVALPGGPHFEAEVAFVALPGDRLLGAFYLESQGARLDRASEALRSVAGMGRTLAHEIKNPLAGIRGAAQLLKLGASPADTPLAQVIVDEVDRIRRLVDQVEAFSDERVTAKRPVNIHRVLDRVRTLVSSAFGAEVKFSDAYDPSLPLAWGDEDQLVQIFLNVAKNAAEAVMERGDGRGEVLIATGYRSGARVSAGRQGWRNAPLEVRLQDNGPGVPADLRHRLFDAFVTTKLGGMGLGLTLVAKLVDAHEGLVELDSEPGRTVFRILLPVAAGDPSSPET